MSTPPDDERAGSEPARPAAYPSAPPYPSAAAGPEQPAGPGAPPPGRPPPGWPAPGWPAPGWPAPGWPAPGWPGPYRPARPEGFFWRPVLVAAGKTAAVLAVVLGAVLLLVVAVGAVAAVGGGDADGPRPLRTGYAAGDPDARDRLLAIPVTGTILGQGEGGGLLGQLGTYGYQVKDELRRAAENPSIRGVVLEMDTPGGTIYGARAIADGVEEYQKRTGRKVVAYVSSLSASGGMYAMAGADRIVADRGTLTGSIGVIYGPITFYDRPTAIDRGVLVGGVETRNGITVEYVTAGRGKDAGNPFRRLTAEERGVIQRGVTRLYGDFVDWVSEKRGIPRQQVVERIGAHAYDEQTARELRLVDEVGNRDDAYARAAELNGLDRWRVDRTERGGGLLDAVLGGRAAGEGERPDSPLCAGRPAMLAYSGDLSRLCE